MGHLPDKRSNGDGSSVATPAFKTITLAELEQRYDIVNVDRQRGAIYATDKTKGPLEYGYAKAIELQSVEGAAGSHSDEPPVSAEQAVGQGQISGGAETRWQRQRLEDYLPELSGKRALEKFNEMKNDGVTRNALKVPKAPVIGARWFMEPASDTDGKSTPLDHEVARFVSLNLNEWMNVSWAEFLMETLLMLDNGVQAFEKVFEWIEWNGERRLYLRKLAPVPAQSIDEFIYDDDGGPSVVMVETEDEPVELEIWKALIFTFDKENGDLWGRSVLRSAYKHWFYKEALYQIDAIQKERHGIGIPVIVLPPNFKPEDRAAAEVIGENLRTNERSHVVLPPQWDVHFLKLEGQRVDALESAEHHAKKLYDNVLAGFIFSTTKQEAEVQEQIFIKSARFTAEHIRSVINHYLIKQLVAFNWPIEELSGYPQLRVRRLGDERDWRILSFAMRNLVGAKILQVDDPLEAWVRSEMDMPVLDPSSIRQVDSPQNPGARVGPPRQQPAAGGTTQGTKPPAANAGTDSSGTSEGG